MKIFKVYNENPQLRVINEAVDVLNSDGLIVYPTDTIYGLGCSLKSKKGLEKLYTIKGMNKNTLLSFITNNIGSISDFAFIDNRQYRVLNKYLPGPFTFILEANRQINKYMFYRRKEVGVRIPENNICNELTLRLGHPIITTSVPLWGDEILNEGEKIAHFFNNTVDIVLDNGILISEPSTIVNITTEPLEIIRQGKGIL